MFPYNSKGVNLDTTFSPAPEGIYDLKIIGASDQKDGIPRRTKNGDPYVNVTCEIANGDYADTKVFHNVTFLPADKKGAGMAVNFLKAIGQEWEGEIEVQPELWVGKVFRAKLKITKDNQDRPKNEIAWLINPEETAALKNANEEEAPF